MADAAKTLELPADVAQAVKRGERVMGTGDGETLAAIVPIEELRRLDALASVQERRARAKRLLDEARRHTLSSEANRYVLTELAKR
jgi:antitoxin (DNA-binding transcriptional repressor) of toxin-antitoxin stability system